MIGLLQKSILSVFVIMLIFLLWQNGNLKEDLADNQGKLEQEIIEKSKYKTLYEKSNTGAKNLQDLADKTLMREQNAYINEAERKLILDNTKTMPHKNKENITEGIVDAETRKKVISRLNRPL